jgi:hypothetical protein
LRFSDLQGRIKRGVAHHAGVRVLRAGRSRNEREQNAH